MTRMARSLTRAGGIVVDTNWRPTAEQAHAMYAAGARAIFRYVFFGPPRPGDLDEVELEMLLDARLTVLIVQHVRNPSWIASADQGDADGAVACANAEKAGYSLDGGQLSLALDMEGVGNPGPMSQAHALAWCASVRAAGYSPVVYLGYDSGLSTVGLEALAKVGRVAWWCDFAEVDQRPKPPSPGYALHQHAQSVLGGVTVDVDEVLLDDVVYGLAQGDAVDDTPDHIDMHTADTIPAPPPEDA